MSLKIEALQRPQRDFVADNKLNWITATVMAVFHIGAVAAFFFFSWKAFFVAFLLWYVSGSFGIGMGYHRLLTHRGYKTSKWVEYFLTTCGTLALEGGPIFWVATHRIHHQFSDKEGDPHTQVSLRAGYRRGNYPVRSRGASIRPLGRISPNGGCSA